LKAVILAAGKGTRLGALTRSLPKPLLEIRGKPILQYNIELCRKHGITRIFVNTHHLARKIKEFLGDGKKFGVSITDSYEPELLGTAGALNNFKSDLQVEPFFVIYGDNIIDYDLTSMYQFHQLKKGIATIALFEKRDVSMSGIAVLTKDGRILKFIEKPKPKEEVSHLANAGLYVLSPQIFDYIHGGFSDFGKNIFPKLIREGKNLFGIVMKGKLDAVDTVDLYNEVREK